MQAYCARFVSVEQVRFYESSQPFALQGNAAAATNRGYKSVVLAWSRRGLWAPEATGIGGGIGTGRAGGVTIAGFDQTKSAAIRANSGSTFTGSVVSHASSYVESSSSSNSPHQQLARVIGKDIAFGSRGSVPLNTCGGKSTAFTDAVIHDHGTIIVDKTLFAIRIVFPVTASSAPMRLRNFRLVERRPTYFFASLALRFAFASGPAIPKTSRSCRLSFGVFPRGLSTALSTAAY